MAPSPRVVPGPIAGITEVARITTDMERTTWMVVRDGSAQRFEWRATATRPMQVAGLTGVALTRM